MISIRKRHTFMKNCNKMKSINDLLTRSYIGSNILVVIAKSVTQCFWCTLSSSINKNKKT